MLQNYYPSSWKQHSPESEYELIIEVPPSTRYCSFYVTIWSDAGIASTEIRNQTGSAGALRRYGQGAVGWIDRLCEAGDAVTVSCLSPPALMMWRDVGVCHPYPSSSVLPNCCNAPIISRRQKDLSRSSLQSLVAIGDFDAAISDLASAFLDTRAGEEIGELRATLELFARRPFLRSDGCGVFAAIVAGL